MQKLIQIPEMWPLRRTDLDICLQEMEFGESARLSVHKKLVGDCDHCFSALRISYTPTYGRA